MKRIFIAVVLMLLSGGLLLINGQSPRQPAPQRLIISEYGVLVDVLDEAGESSFGLVEHDGFKLVYVFGEEKTVSARGADSAGLRPGVVHAYGNSAKVTVTTSDGGLEIANEFTLDEQRNQLIIRRTLKNISGAELSLVSTEMYLDPKLIGITSSFNRARVRNIAVRRLKATGCIDSESNLSDRPPHDPPCDSNICLTQVGLRRGTLVTPVTLLESTNPISILWNCKKKLLPLCKTSSRDLGTGVYFGVGLNLQSSN